MIQMAQPGTPTCCRPTPGRLAIVLLFAAMLGVGCAGPRVNPSFPLSLKRAETELRRMHSDPKALPRPVVVLGGWGDLLGLPPAYLAEQLRLATGDDRVISIGFGGCDSFDECGQRVIQRVQEAFPTDGHDWTDEVDVVGYSMGGLVARYTAAPLPGDAEPSRRLRVVRLFTISTPHRGAKIAKFAASGSLGQDMRAGSDFLQHLDKHLPAADYPIVPYVRLGDAVVGATNAAPHDQASWWLPRQPFSRSHNDAYRDPRLIAEIARRLRHETPYTTDPAAPVPQ